MYCAITNNIFKITLKQFTTSEDSGQPGQMLSLIKAQAVLKAPLLYQHENCFHLKLDGGRVSICTLLPVWVQKMTGCPSVCVFIPQSGSPLELFENIYV